MYFNYYRAVSGVSATIFFLSLVLLGQKVLLNLFLAILLQNFDESAIKQRLQDQIQVEERLKMLEHSHGQFTFSWLQRTKTKISKMFNYCINRERYLENLSLSLR
jgi:hypothetical protein